MSAFSLLAGALESVLEKELMNATPVLADIVVQEVELLIAKLESMLSLKSKQVAQ